MNTRELLHGIETGNSKAIARAISLVENEISGYDDLLRALPIRNKPVIGITGPPGAGKSTLTDALIKLWVAEQQKVAVICIDPSSPFKSGAILGDRIRMHAWYNHPDVFIRSLATRGSLGGLHPKIIEITDLLKAGQFDRIIIETVGVGQSEVEIAGLADLTVVVLVPEAGDDIQVMKAGLMEIADIFVVNKSDRPMADAFVHNLQSMLLPGLSHHEKPVPVVKTIASNETGVDLLHAAIMKALRDDASTDRKYVLLAEKAWQLIVHKKMQHVDKRSIVEEIRVQARDAGFNLYRFIERFY